jgi:hypothetical protein
MTDRDPVVDCVDRERAANRWFSLLVTLPNIDMLQERACLESPEHNLLCYTDLEGSLLKRESCPAAGVDERYRLPRCTGRAAVTWVPIDTMPPGPFVAPN